MIARASGSGSTASRCSYQPIASASSVTDAQSRAKVLVSAGSSSGGSWYWSNPTAASFHGPLGDRALASSVADGRRLEASRGGGGGDPGPLWAGGLPTVRQGGAGEVPRARTDPKGRARRRPLRRRRGGRKLLHHRVRRGGDRRGLPRGRRALHRPPRPA